MLVAMSDTLTTHEYADDLRYEVFNREFMPHIDSMYNFAFRLTMDEDDANDLVAGYLFKGISFYFFF